MADIMSHLVSDWYDEGIQAYKDGKAFLDCPHVQPDSLRSALTAWMAGWMYEMQQQQQAPKLLVTRAEVPINPTQK